MEPNLKFHALAGTHISAKIFLEYCDFLKGEYNPKEVKGDRTRLNRLIEAEASIKRIIKYLSDDLQAIGVDLNISQQQVNGIESTFYEVLSLEEPDQLRVMGLIKKLKKERNLEVA